jgi:bacteriocin biosynthesis cyclodehydratase domain-containing protein
MRRPTDSRRYLSGIVRGVAVALSYLPSMSVNHRRPRLALPFTVLTDRDTVRLLAGEDFRYTLTGVDLEAWLPAWLSRLDGRTPLEEALSCLPQARREAARQLVERLYGERVLIDGSSAEAHAPIRCRLVAEGSAAWVVDWQTAGDDTLARLPALCQDRLDYEEALSFNRRCLKTGTPWLWASTGPMNRAYVSPLFLPDAGPCLSCLVRHFRRLSPVPELYAGLTGHARDGGSVVPVPFPTQAAAIVRQLLLWKAALAEEPEAYMALYRLHVLEVSSMEVSSHRVFVDPECPECGGRN